MTETPAAEWLELPPSFPTRSRASVQFIKLASKLKRAAAEQVEHRSAKISAALLQATAADAAAPQHRAALSAAALVLADLARQGWLVGVSKGRVRVQPPAPTTDRDIEKQRVREQESVKRDQQLRTPSVARFIQGMERRRTHAGSVVSIFSLMRDGRDLSDKLRLAGRAKGEARTSMLQHAIDPYVQLVVPNQRCELTGFWLTDIWRYFRHTWTTPYESVPGRGMMFIVRDRAAPFHPAIGIGALASPIVQLGQRDKWLEWDADTVIAKLRDNPTLRVARWLIVTADRALSDVSVADFIEGGLLSPADLRDPTEKVIDKLRKVAARNAKTHKDLARAQDLKQARDEALDPEEFWQRRSRSRLFKWRRAALLAELLTVRLTLRRLLGKTPTLPRLRALLDDAEGLRAIRFVVRKARGDRVGIAMADISVCGAVAPYNAILGGKLVSMLAVGPQIIDAYKRKYAKAQSEIASAIAGRPIVRSSQLVFLGTTSLYALGSSQYNRVRIPCERIGGPPGREIRFEEIGHSEAFGSSHLSGQALDALANLTAQMRDRREVRNVFGEGVSPRLRKARHGLELLGFPANDLLRHGRRRIIYGVVLAENAREYLLGMTRTPRYLAPIREVEAASAGIAAWWIERWLSNRVDSEEVLQRVSENDLTHPVRHGARVNLPDVTISSDAATDIV